MKKDKFKIAFDGWIEKYYPNTYDLPLYFVNMLKMEFINTQLEGHIKIERLNEVYWAEIKCKNEIIKFCDKDYLEMVSGSVDRYEKIYNE